MLDWFRRPYPFLYESLTIRIRVALFIVVFVFLFLTTFRPFDLEKVIQINLYLGAFLYGITSGLIVFLTGTAMMRFFPNFFTDNGWNIGKELLCTNLILIAAAIGNAILGYYIQCRPEQTGLSSFWYSIGQGFTHTYTIGIFPVTVLTAISYSIFLKRNLTRVMEHNQKLDARQETKPESHENQVVTIVSPNNNNDFSFRLNDLLFIMADGNYVEFHMESDNSVKREIKRNTLSHIESQLAEYDFLFRSHRAYLVNLKKVVHSSGNAQGYELQLTKTDHKVPVSRRNLSKFDNLIKR